MVAPTRRLIRSRRAGLLVLTATMIAAGTVAAATSQDVPAAAAGDPVIVAAGDIACSTEQPEYNRGEGTATECRQKHTSDMILGADHVFVLGDAQYPIGNPEQFRAVYDPTWGRMKSVTYPTPGDHEYQSGSPDGYFDYFGVEPYYSFDIGSWHWVSLNSEIDHAAGSPQVQWLREDLAATDQPCIGAFWGAPAFSSSAKGNNPSYRPFWDALYAVHADLVLSGDSHQYERFAKQTPGGTAASDGIRQFVVGTGGRSLDGFVTKQSNSEAQGKVFGVLELRLGFSHYNWRFRTDSGGSFSDAGSATCNG
jgi:acid phosphatase type 7